MSMSDLGHRIALWGLIVTVIIGVLGGIFGTILKIVNDAFNAIEVHAQRNDKQFYQMGTRTDEQLDRLRAYVGDLNRRVAKLEGRELHEERNTQRTPRGWVLD